MATAILPLRGEANAEHFRLGGAAEARILPIAPASADDAMGRVAYQSARAADAIAKHFDRSTRVLVVTTGVVAATAGVVVATTKHIDRSARVLVVTVGVVVATAGVVVAMAKHIDRSASVVVVTTNAVVAIASAVVATASATDASAGVVDAIVRAKAAAVSAKGVKVDVKSARFDAKGVQVSVRRACFTPGQSPITAHNRTGGLQTTIATSADFARRGLEAVSFWLLAVSHTAVAATKTASSSAVRALLRPPLRPTMGRNTMPYGNPEEGP